MTEQLLKKKEEFDFKLEQVKAIVSSKDTLIDSMQRNEELLVREILDLKEQILADQEAAKQAAMISAAADPTSPKAMPRLSTKYTMKSKPETNDVTFKTITSNLNDLEDSMKQYELQETQKKNILSGIERLVKSMLKTTSASVGVQCEDGMTHLGGVD